MKEKMKVARKLETVHTYTHTGSLENKKGITLVALTVTIIILLILAGISIASLKENGLFEKAKEAQVENNHQVNLEKVRLKLYDIQMQIASDNLELNLKTIAKKLKNDDEVEYEYLLFDKQESINVDEYDQVEIDELDSKTGEAKYIILKLYNNVDVYIIDSKFEVNVEDTGYRIAVNINTKLEHAKLTNKIVFKDERYRTEIEVENGEVIDVIEVKMNGEDITSTSVNENVISIDSVTGNLEIKVLTSWDGTTISTGLEGVGTQEKPYVINTGADLAYMAQQINAGNTSKINITDETMAYNAYYELKSNIRLNKTSNIENKLNLNNWIPIGTETNSFQGIFDGNYKEVQNLYIDSTSALQGLFGYLRGATVKETIIDNKSIVTTTNGYVGAIAGVANNESTISCCGNYGSVTGLIYAGGICGTASSSSVTIEKCFNKGKITTNKYACGGIVGDNYANINHCYSTNNVSALGCTSASYTNVGGICGYNSGYVSYCYTISPISGYNSNGRGMIVGQQFSGAYTNYSYALNNQSYGIIGYKKGGSSVGCEKLSSETIKAWDETTINSKLGDVFCNDVKEDEKTNEDGTTTIKWRYNSGYPILKWEKENL